MAFSRLGLHMNEVTKTDAFCDNAQAQWLLYAYDSNLDVLQSEYDKTGDICRYWHQISDVSDGSDGTKYNNLSHVAMSALTLAHGNAVPKRGFSVNNALLGKESRKSHGEYVRYQEEKRCLEALEKQKREQEETWQKTSDKLTREKKIF